MESNDPEKDSNIDNQSLSKNLSGEESKLAEASELGYAPQYESELNPTFEMYLKKTTEIPEHLLQPKYFSKNVFEKVVLASYPRSGNTMTRKYLEDITGVITGSDFDQKRDIAHNLIEEGMVGEGKVDDKVWIIKTHFPMGPINVKCDANKCILLVRNPMDAMASAINFMTSYNHSWSIADYHLEKSKPYLDTFVNIEAAQWRNFHSYWMDEPAIPTYIVRYEDLLFDKKNTLLDLFRFLLNEKNLEGTLIEALIEHHANPELKKEVYIPRKGKANCNKHLYSESQIKKIKQESGQMLKRMGYVKEDSDISNNTEYYSDDEDIESSIQHNCETFTRNGEEIEVKTRYNYKELNEIMLNKVCSDEYKNSVKECSDLTSIEINRFDDYLPDEYPEGKGPFGYFEKLSKTLDFVLPDGTIKKAEES